MRWTVAILTLACLAFSSPGAESTHRAAAHRTHPYRKHWKHETFGKRALIGTAAAAGISQARGSHKEYGGGVGGFGKRWGAGFATHGVTTTVEHVVAAPLHEDLHYHRSSSKHFGPRLRHALASTVVARNTRSGKKQPAAGRVSGHAAAGAFAATVLPAASGAATAGIGLAAVAGTNVAREFWPRPGPKHAKRHR